MDNAGANVEVFSLATFPCDFIEVCNPFLIVNKEKYGFFSFSLFIVDYSVLPRFRVPPFCLLKRQGQIIVRPLVILILKRCCAVSNSRLGTMGLGCIELLK